MKWLFFLFVVIRVMPEAVEGEILRRHSPPYVRPPPRPLSRPRASTGILSQDARDALLSRWEELQAYFPLAVLLVPQVDFLMRTRRILHMIVRHTPPSGRGILIRLDLVSTEIKHSEVTGADAHPSWTTGLRGLLLLLK
ncbi:uncharacterized protein [Macrobrachium rosenbergii]|uniref:uncharacterized protein n=1 Tax=Macrobrachium rosenbergii TaxID=79674 RepID=UPI0034D64630